MISNILTDFVKNTLNWFSSLTVKGWIILFAVVVVVAVIASIVRFLSRLALYIISGILIIVVLSTTWNQRTNFQDCLSECECRIIDRVNITFPDAINYCD